MTDDVICERTYQTVYAGVVAPVHVRWFRPADGPMGWYCEFEIVWPDQQTKRTKIYAADSVQAIDLSLKCAASVLYVTEPQVFWEEPDDVLGLPTLEAAADLEAARTKGRG